MLAAMKAAALWIALVGCGGGPAVPLSNRAAEPAGAVAGGSGSAEPVVTGVAATLAKLEKFSDDMCGCANRDCADRVVDDMSRWAQELASAGAANPRVNFAEDARAKAATDRISRCMVAVYARRGTGAAAAQPGAPAQLQAGSQVQTQ